MSPRRRNPPLEDPRTALMDAALRAFADRGYEGATIKDIAREAGVAQGLLYHYFPSKEAVLRALFERSGGYVLQAFGEVAQITDPAARLRALILTSARLVRQHEDFWRVSYGVRFQHAVLQGLAEGITAQSALFRSMITALFGELGHPEPTLEAHLLFATLDGVFQHYVLAPASYPLDALLERLIQAHGGPPAEETPWEGCSSSSSRI